MVIGLGKKMLLSVYTVYAILLFGVLGSVGIFYYLLVLLLLPNKKKGQWLYAYNWFYAATFGLLTGIKYVVRGKEYFGYNKAYVITANHNAIADLFIAPYALGGINYRPLGKVELKKIPVWGVLARFALVFVDRKSPESRHKSLLALEELINREGISILIFPEGTRNRTNNLLAHFYDGAFRIAIECKVPVVPMVLYNVKQVTPQNQFLLYPGTLTCQFLAPIPTDGLTEDDIPALKDKVHAMMLQALQASA